MAPFVKSPSQPVVLRYLHALMLGFWLIFKNPDTGFAMQERILIAFVSLVQRNPVYANSVMIMS